MNSKKTQNKTPNNTQAGDSNLMQQQSNSPGAVQIIKNFLINMKNNNTAIVALCVVAVVAVVVVALSLNDKDNDNIIQTPTTAITTTTTTNPPETIPVISDETVEYFPEYPYEYEKSLVNILNEYDVPNAIDRKSPQRMAIAVANGFTFEDYTGEKWQNNELVKKAKEGLLIKPSEELIKEMESKINELYKQEEN